MTFAPVHPAGLLEMRLSERIRFRRLASFVCRDFGPTGYEFVVQLCIRPPKRARGSDWTRSIVQFGFQSQDNSAHPSGLGFNRIASPMALSPIRELLEQAISQLLFIQPGATSFPTSPSVAAGAFQNQRCRRQPALSKRVINRVSNRWAFKLCN